MKKLAAVLCTLLVCSCTKELSSDQLVEINGLSYEVNSRTPFTGRLIDFYENGLFVEAKWSNAVGLGIQYVSTHPYRHTKPRKDHAI